MKHLIRTASLFVIITTAVEARSSVMTALLSEKELITVLFNGALSERLVTTGVILMEIILLFAAVYYWRKNRNRKARAPLLKDNIKAIRDERINPNLIESKNENRKSLKNFIRINAINGKKLSQKAKKLSVAKGEIILAARIEQIKSQVQ